MMFINKIINLKIISLIVVALLSVLYLEAQKNPGLLYPDAVPATMNSVEISSFNGMSDKRIEKFMNIIPECDEPPNYNVYCFAPYSQCLGIFNQSGLRNYSYQNFYMVVDIVFDKKPNKIKLNGTVDITVDAGQNPLHVYFQDVIWEYEGGFNSWQLISQTGLGFSNKSFQAKSRWNGPNKEFYIRLRFAPKNIFIGNFNSLGGIPSGKYGFELQPRFTFINLI